MWLVVHDTDHCSPSPIVRGDYRSDRLAGSGSGDGLFVALHVIRPNPHRKFVDADPSDSFCRNRDDPLLREVCGEYADWH